MTRLLASVASLLFVCSTAQAQVALQVLDIGAEPRSQLRYQFQAGKTELAMMEMTMNMVREENGKQVQMASMPGIRSTMRLHVKEVKPDGSARIEFETTSAEAPAGQAAGPGAGNSLNQSLAMMSQLKGWYVTDTRGRTSDSGMSAPIDGLSPEAGQMMTEMMNSSDESMEPFPEEAVGPGARWLVVTTTDVAGMKISQAQEFTLRSRTGNRVTLDTKIIDPPAGMGSSQIAGMPFSSVTTGTGTMVLDLQGLSPDMTMEINSTTTMPAMPQSQGQPQKMMMQMKMTSGLATD